MKLVLTADKRLTGEFAVNLSDQIPVLTTDGQEGNTVTVNFSNDVSGSAGVFYIPAPLGTYGNLTAEIMDGDVVLASKVWMDQTVNRKTPKRGTVDVDYVAEISGSIYQSLQAAFDDADNQVIILEHDLVIDEPVVVTSGKTAVLDLNGKPCLRLLLHQPHQD